MNNQRFSSPPPRPTVPPAPRRTPSPEARVFSSVIMWFIVLLVLATAAGIWYRVFWLGWVVAP